MKATTLEAPPISGNLEEVWFDACGDTTWVESVTREDGVIQIGRWSATEVLVAWERALYDNHIMDPGSDYLARSNVEFVNRAIAEPGLLTDIELPTLRCALIFLARRGTLGAAGTSRRSDPEWHRRPRGDSAIWRQPLAGSAMEWMRSLCPPDDAGSQEPLSRT